MATVPRYRGAFRSSPCNFPSILPRIIWDLLMVIVAFLLSLSAFIVFGFGWYCYLEDSRQSIIRLFLPIFLWGFCLVLLLVVYKERKLSSIILQNQPGIKNGNDLPTKWDLYDDTEFIVLSFLFEMMPVWLFLAPYTPVYL